MENISDLKEKHGIAKSTIRTYDLTVYFRDAPHPWHFENVCHMATEGNLLRIIIAGKSQWFPVTNIFRILENSKMEN